MNLNTLSPADAVAVCAGLLLAVVCIGGIVAAVYKQLMSVGSSIDTDLEAYYE